jgi:large subunit ribosomal protein L9
MDIILLERVEKLGQIGDVVSVKPGYARNFLLPKKKALRATKVNISLFESQRTQIEAVNLERRNEAESVAAKLEGFSVVVIRQAGDSGQLYGSVTGRDIADAVIEKGVTIDRGQVRLERPIKTLGLHDVRVQLHPEVSVAVTANVARSDDAAQRQAEAGRMVTDEEEAAAEAEAEAALEAAVAAAAEDEVEDGAEDEAEADDSAELASEEAEDETPAKS